MTLLTLSGLALTRGQPLFADLDLTLGAGDRLGLVAPNGRGKSSLLSLIDGTEVPTAGEITRARGLLTALVPQDVPTDLMAMSVRDTVLSGLAPEVADYEFWRADITLDELEMPAELHGRAMAEVSGGWQRIALLGRALVQAPDLLLLDEPTNHLDIARIGHLQRVLAALPKDCAAILSSHDRAFLDAVTTRTLFLRPEASPHFALPYTRARAALDEADAARDRAHANELKKARQLRAQAAKLKNIGINSGSDLLTVKTRQLKERADRIEDSARAPYRQGSAGAVRLAHSGTHAKALISIDEIDVRTPDDRALFRTPKLWIEPGDRVVLLGPNGAGKTRMVRRIVAALCGEGAGVRAAASARPGICDQDLGQVDAYPTPWEAVSRAHDGGDERSRALLAGAGIAVDRQTGPTAALSGGQRARLAMLLLRLRRPNFYLLDEPTNHLDIEGQEALEEELLDPQATCLLVSHDRAFVQAVATRVWSIERRRLVEVADPGPVFDALMSAGRGV